MLGEVVYFFKKNAFFFIKQIIPWCIAAGIFYMLFQKYPVSDVWDALQLVHLPSFFLLAIIYFLVIFSVDSIVMQRMLQRFGYTLPLNDICRGRGMTYMIMILSYPASQAAFAYYLNKKQHVPIVTVLSSFVFTLFLDLFWIITLAFVGSFFQDYMVRGADLGHIVRLCAIVFYSMAGIWLAFWCDWPKKLWNSVSIFNSLKQHPHFSFFYQATLSDYCRFALMRIPIHMTIILFMYAIIWAFDAYVPLIKLISNIPLVFLVGTLPITPGGLGTTNAMMVELLAPHTSGTVIANNMISADDLIFAISILWFFANYLLKIGCSVLFQVIGRQKRD